MIKNRKARFDYELLEDFTAGMVLCGTEVKSIRNNKASIADAYCLVVNGEVFVRNMNVEQHQDALTQHEPRRDRKLLLSKKEINRIAKALMDKGITLVPTMLKNEGRTIKMNVSIAKGKKEYDKRNTIKDRDHEREVRRQLA